MAGELATSQRRLERSRARDGAQERRARRTAALHRNCPRAHRDRRHLNRARRPGQHDQRRRGAAARGRDRMRSARRSSRCSGARTCSRSPRWCARSSRAAASRPRQEIALARDGREIHLAAAATALQGEGGAHEGTVLVFDDVTPLVRTQRVAAWRDVARRLAHEIKNPLTPIQLSAERMSRHFAGAPGSHPRPGRRVHQRHRHRGRVAQGAG